MICGFNVEPEVAFRDDQKPKEKSMNTKLKVAIMAVALGLAVQANASMYDIAYTQVGATSAYGSPVPGTTTDATGTLTVIGNTVISGTLTVTGTGPDNGTYTLISSTGSDSLIQYDNVWPITTTGGLAWSLTGAANTASTEMNMWSTDGGEYGQPSGYYALWGGASGQSSTFNVESYGNLTVTAVPEPTTIVSGVLMLLPFGASTLRILRRRVA
jgi:hypothetical protein